MMLHLFLALLLRTAFGLRFPTARIRDRLVLSLQGTTGLSDAAGLRLYNAAYAGDTAKLQVLLAEAKGNKATLNWRNEERYGRTPLVIAAYYNKLEAVKLLCSTSGVDVNASSDFGATALHFAAHRGHLEVVQVLLSKGAKVNALATGGKWTGKTPLDVVTGMGMSGKAEVGEAIKAKGGKPSK
jgi:26S proteasome non-ATPase regulatory subunit 10